jgi:hypothetical protein
VTLDASDRRDPEHRLISFIWEVVETPAASEVSADSLTDVASPRPVFTPDVDGCYVLRVEVSNGELSDVSRVVISAQPTNVAPNADAGRSRDELTGTSMALDGRRSMDPDEGPSPLSYRWTCERVPPTSTVRSDDIVDADQALATLSVDVDGVYVLRLEISDGDLSSSDKLVIRASSEDVPPNAHAGSGASSASAPAASGLAIANSAPRR